MLASASSSHARHMPQWGSPLLIVTCREGLCNSHSTEDPRWTFPLNSATLSIYIPYWIESIQKFKIHFLHLKYFLIQKKQKSKKIISNLIWSFFKLQIRLEMILKDSLWRLIPCDETYHLETSPCHGSSLSWGSIHLLQHMHGHRQALSRFL